jgi:EAL domain-containing protein (putative c-di-GMP-specific phosphodiesterase class I)
MGGRKASELGARTCGDCAYYLERGEVEVSILRQGERIVLGRRGPGEMFGEMAIVDGQPRSATVTTLAPSSFVLITREQLRTQLEQADPALRLCLSLLLDRLRSTLDQVRSLDAAAPGASAGGSGGGLAPPDRARGAEAAAAIRLDHELETALAEGQLELHYQPIVDLREAAGGQVAGFEALVRRRHPDRGLVPPRDFSPAVEASGLIRRIDAWVVDEACTAARRFEAARAANGRGGQESFFVSVNVCGQDLAHAGFVDRVTRGLRAANLRPGALKLEITETTLVTAGADEVLRAAKDRGIGVVLDDSGTGYSSLSYLQRFPIDALKLDRSFLTAWASTSRRRSWSAYSGSLSCWASRWSPKGSRTLRRQGS